MVVQPRSTHTLSLSLSLPLFYFTTKRIPIPLSVPPLPPPPSPLRSRLVRLSPPTPRICTTSDAILVARANFIEMQNQSRLFAELLADAYVASANLHLQFPILGQTTRHPFHPSAAITPRFLFTRLTTDRSTYLERRKARFNFVEKERCLSYLFPFPSPVESNSIALL